MRILALYGDSTRLRLRSARFSVISTVATKELVTSGFCAQSWIWMSVWLRSAT